MQSHRRLIFWTVFVAALAAGIWAVVRFVSPMPPRTLAMSTGVVDGAYHHFGQRYREVLQANGIALELRSSSGGIENLARLNDGSVSVAFVQGGTGPMPVDAEALAESTPLRSLATIAYEPVWIFTHTLDLSKGLDVLAGRRVAVGVAGSGNEKVATQLLAAYGITADGPSPARATLVSEGGMAVVELLRRREIDAAIIVAASAAPAVQRLLADESMHLASLDHVEGLARRFGYFQPVTPEARLGRSGTRPAPSRHQPAGHHRQPGRARRVAPGVGVPVARSRAAGPRGAEPHPRSGRVSQPERNRVPVGAGSRALLQGRPAVPAELSAVLDGEPGAASRFPARSLGGHPDSPGPAAARGHFAATEKRPVPPLWRVEVSREGPDVPHARRRGTAQGQSDSSTGSRTSWFRPSSRSTCRTGSTPCASTSTLSGPS